MNTRRVYFDNNAATWVDPDVLDLLRIENERIVGNPSGVHRASREARMQLDRARARIVQSLQTQDHRVIFTSGATESNNLALVGSLNSSRNDFGTFLISAIEHPSIREPGDRLARDGHRMAKVPVDHTGTIDLDRLEVMLSEMAPDLVSIMGVNNETGTIQPIDRVSALCRNRGIPLHTDAVQAPGRTPMDIFMKADLVTLSSHKIHGPKGLGAILVRKDTVLSPLLLGGAQEGGLRAGTENTPAILGFATALERSTTDLTERSQHFHDLRETFLEGLATVHPGMEVNGHPERNIPNTLNLRFPGIAANTLVLALDHAGIAVGTGAACSTGTRTASAVLLAMHRSRSAAMESIRISFSIRNTLDEVKFAVSHLTEILERLRPR